MTEASRKLTRCYLLTGGARRYARYVFKNKIAPQVREVLVTRTTIQAPVTTLHCVSIRSRVCGRHNARYSFKNNVAPRVLEVLVTGAALQVTLETQMEVATQATMGMQMRVAVH